MHKRRIKPRHSALEQKKDENIKLNDRGADVNAKSCVCTPLQRAVKEGNMEIIKMLIDKGANVNAKDRCSDTPDQIAEEPLTRGASIGCVCTYSAMGYTPLHIAAEKGNAEVVRLLLEHGALVDAQDKNGNTVLYLAIEMGNLNIVTDIFKHCPDMNIQSNKQIFIDAVTVNPKDILKKISETTNNIVETFLHYGVTTNIAREEASNTKLMHAAIENGYLQIVKDLLKNGAHCNKFSKEHFTPLHTAAKNNQVEVAEFLITHGDNHMIYARDKNHRSPIFYAVKNKNVKLFQLFLGNREILNINTELLSIAIVMSCRPIVDILLRYDVDINARDDSGITALHCIFFSEDNEFNDEYHCEMARLLLSKGANVNARTIHGRVPLHVAAIKGLSKTTQALLEYNADVNCVKERDMTPFHHFNHKGVVDISILNTRCRDDEQFTALHYASCKGHQEVIEVLLEHGANVNLRDENGNKPLHVASIFRQRNIVEILAPLTANIDIKNCFGKTPLQYAFEFDKDAGAIHALLTNGADINSLCEGIREFYNRRDSFDESDLLIANILKQHIVKLKTAGFHVDIKLQCLLNFKHTELELEIETMKNRIIGNSKISFFDFLTNDINQIGVNVKDESIVEALKCDDLEEDFPILADQLEFQLNMAMRRKKLLERGRSVFERLSTCPLELSEKVLNYLDTAELYNFVRDFESKN